MADPLSIAAGVIGILTAAAQISSLLIEFTSTSKDAPQTARAVLIEVNDIRSTLGHLQLFLSGNECYDKSKTQLLQVNQVVTIMSGCVLTFSELERVLDGLKAEGMGILDRAHWARKEKAIGKLVQRLQDHKASLSLILHVLNGNTIMEAKNSVDRLHGMIERCYQEMSSRMEALELRNSRFPDESSVYHRLGSDTSSVMTIKAPKFDPSEPERALTTSNSMLAFDLTEILRKTWVYRRNKALDVSDSSLYSRDTCSMTWSCLSDLSWAEVSNISVIGLPISVDEVHNPLRSSQTWSNDVIDPVWPVISPVGLAANTHAAAELPTHGSTIEPPAVDFRDNDMAPSPCKGCRENLQTGKAMKLEQNYWHLNCFRCNTCGTMLDSDSSLLLLEDGSLICNNCTYNCSSCGMQIIDVSIYTGDRVFCAECFKCQNCKMKIKDPEYARISQGIFCYDCHNAPMARRQMKPRAPAATCPHCGKLQIGTTSTGLFCTNTGCDRCYFKQKTD